MKNYDIVIAGGGMVGSSLALALAPLGLRTAIVEPVSREAGRQPSFDDRSTALSRSTQRMFEAMGTWDAVVAASTPITNVHVSDRGRFGFAHIDAQEQGVEAHEVRQLEGRGLRPRQRGTGDRIDLFTESCKIS